MGYAFLQKGADRCDENDGIVDENSGTKEAMDPLILFDAPAVVIRDDDDNRTCKYRNAILVAANFRRISLSRYL